MKKLSLVAFTILTIFLLYYISQKNYNNHYILQKNPKIDQIVPNEKSRSIQSKTPIEEYNLDKEKPNQNIEFSQKKEKPSFTRLTIQQDTISPNNEIIATLKLLEDGNEEIDLLSLDFQAIQSCEQCLENLTILLQSGRLTHKNLALLATAMMRSNNNKMVQMLLSTANEHLHRDIHSEQADAILWALTSNDSPEMADQFIDHLIESKYLNAHEKITSKIIEGINQVTDRELMAQYIYERYEKDFTESNRDLIMSIKHPESLEKIAQYQLKNWNINDYHKTLEALQSIDNKNTFSAYFNLYKSQPDYTEIRSSTIASAEKWAESHMNKDALELMEQQLYISSLPENEKSFILALIHKSKEKEIIEKIVSNSNVFGE